MKKVISITAKETNPFVNAELANNGGGYSQPLTTVTFADGVRVEIADTSCGDFGSRYSVGFFRDADLVGEAYWGSMEDARLWYSTISGSEFGGYIEAVKESLGIVLYTEEDYCNDLEAEA